MRRLWELAGWLLLGLGLFMFYVVAALLLSKEPSLLEAGPLTVIGIVIFRGGIHLLKVGAAAQACRELQAHLREPKPVSKARVTAPLRDRRP